MADAATTATATAKGSNEEVVDIDLSDPQVGEAAKKIQSAFRIKRFEKKTPEADKPTKEQTK